MAQYIGHLEDNSSASSVVVIDIAESLDISGFTPAIAVSSIPALTVSSIVLASPMAVSGTVTTAAPANQNVSGTSLDDIETNTSNISGAVNSAKMDVNVAAYDTTGAVTVEAGDSKIPVQMYATAPGGGSASLELDGNGNLMMNASGTSISVRPSISEDDFLSCATFTFDAGGDIPASDTEVIAAGGLNTRILIYGITISSTGTSGRGYWYLTDGAFVNDGSTHNKASGAIDAGNGVAVTNLTFPFPVAIRANSAVNISVTEAVSQAYLVGTVYYKVADYN